MITPRHLYTTALLVTLMGCERSGATANGTDAARDVRTRDHGTTTDGADDTPTDTFATPYVSDAAT